MVDRIEIDANVHFGRPCVAGTRIPVVDVLELVEQGVAFEEILRDHYPDLCREDLQACLRYAIEVIGAEDLHISSAS